MEPIFELAFIMAGHLVQILGGVLAILLIGLLPIYLLVYGLYRTHTPMTSSVEALAVALIAVMMALCLSGLFFTSAMVLSAWGPFSTG